MADTLNVNRRKYLSAGISHYVPAMAFDASLVDNAPAPFSLGVPAASDDDLIDASIAANATAGTIETQSWTADSYYGRTLIVTPSADPGAAGGVLTVHGKDWLGQPMLETFSGANGSTAILYGKKAFYTVTKAVITTATTNAITYKLGTGLRCGLPFKGTVSWARESGLQVALYKGDQMFQGSLSDADVTSGGSLLFYPPFPGFVKTLIGMPSGAGSTTNAATTVEVATVAVTGLTVTVDQDTQTIVTDAPTTAGYNANNRFRPGTLLELVHAATTAGGPTSFALELTSTQVVLPDVTDPATATTGDPRGSYESLATLAGFEIIVGIMGDSSVNASGNGGLHGIQHFYA